MIVTTAAKAQYRMRDQRAGRERGRPWRSSGCLGEQGRRFPRAKGALEELKASCWA